MKNLVLMAAFVAVMVASIIQIVRDNATVPTPAQPTQVMAEAQPTQVVAKFGSYWSKSVNKSFKAIEYGCTLGWKQVGMPTGCVIVIDLTRKGYGHNGISGPFGVVIPSDKGVTIATGWYRKVYVAAAAKTYIFVVIDDKDASVVSKFTPNESLWDEKLLREFFTAQMGGDVETIWREGVSDID